MAGHAHMAGKSGKSRKRAGSSASREFVLQQQPQRQPKARTHNKLAQAQNRWQRAVRYVWDKKRG